jgi:hypothetical protein
MPSNLAQLSLLSSPLPSHKRRQKEEAKEFFLHALHFYCYKKTKFFIIAAVPTLQQQKQRYSFPFCFAFHHFRFLYARDCDENEEEEMRTFCVFNVEMTIEMMKLCFGDL